MTPIRLIASPTVGGGADVDPAVVAALARAAALAWAADHHLGPVAVAVDALRWHPPVAATPSGGKAAGWQVALTLTPTGAAGAHPAAPCAAGTGVAA